MFESKNVKAIGEIAIVDRVWETRYQIAAYGLLDDSPPFRCFKNHVYCSIRFIKDRTPRVATEAS
jgi:hypothetical protein